MNTCDVLVICAKPEEAEGVRTTLPESCTRFRNESYQHCLYWSTEVTNGANERLTVFLTRCPAMGGQALAATLPDLLRTFRPRFVAMTGKCAGCRQRGVALGDLMLIDRVYDID